MRVALVIAGPYPAVPRLAGAGVAPGRGPAAARPRGRASSRTDRGVADRPGPQPGAPGARRAAARAAVADRAARADRRDPRAQLRGGDRRRSSSAALTGRPVVYHGHSALADELPTYYASPRPRRRWMGRLGRLLDAQVPRRADFCIAVSDELGARAAARRASPGDVLACIEPAAAPAELDGAAGRRRRRAALVCYAGNLDGYQNLDFLLRGVRARPRRRAGRAPACSSRHPDAHDQAARLVARGLGPGVEIVLAASYDEVRAARAAMPPSPSARAPRARASR